jgi:hypothetical protein
MLLWQLLVCGLKGLCDMRMHAMSRCVIYSSLVCYKLKGQKKGKNPNSKLATKL